MKTKICFCTQCGVNTVWDSFPKDGHKSNFYKDIPLWQCSKCGDVKGEDSNAGDLLRS